MAPPFKTKSLTPDLINIVKNKGTEPPHTGEYNHLSDHGTYLCRQCGLGLFHSSDKLISSCGWPAFDDEVLGAIKRQPDPDGHRTEILCQRCEAHLGHVFAGEGLSPKNQRHCVNSLAIEFIPHVTVTDTEEAIFAGGCFWGVQHLMDDTIGVLKTEVGYTMGSLGSPRYEDVCSGQTGHVEATRVLYDPTLTTYETVTKRFLEIHDPTQKDRQGPDIGAQYASVIFYFNEKQKQIANDLLDQLRTKGFDIATQIVEITPFWPAEEHHQNYYKKNGKAPYCHTLVARFD